MSQILSLNSVQPFKIIKVRNKLKVLMTFAPSGICDYSFVLERNRRPYKNVHFMLIYEMSFWRIS